MLEIIKVIWRGLRAAFLWILALLGVYGTAKDATELTDWLDSNGFLASALHIVEKHWFGILLALLGLAFLIGLMVDEPKKKLKKEYREKRRSVRKSNGHRK